MGNVKVNEQSSYLPSEWYLYSLNTFSLYENDCSCLILTLVTHSSQMTPDRSFCMAGCSCVGLFCRTKHLLTTNQSKRGCSFGQDANALPASCVLCCTKSTEQGEFLTNNINLLLSKSGCFAKLDLVDEFCFLWLMHGVKEIQFLCP